MLWSKPFWILNSGVTIWVSACRQRWRGKRTCMLISACAYRLKAIRSSSRRLVIRGLPWNIAWLPTIQSATAASRWARRKRWGPSVGSCQTSGGGQTQTLGAGPAGYHLDRLQSTGGTRNARRSPVSGVLAAHLQREHLAGHRLAHDDSGIQRGQSVCCSGRGKASGSKTGQTSYVLCHQPKSFDWRLRKAKAHPLGTLANALFAQVCERLNQIIQVG